MEITKGKVTWIDIVKPSADDLNWLQKKVHFHPLLIHELKGPSARARVESYDHYLYLIYHFPVYDPVEKVSERREINLLITNKEVISVRYEELEAVNDFKKILERPEYKDKAFQSTLHLTYYLIITLLQFNQRQLRHIQEKVEKVSTELFKDNEKQVLREISYLKRDMSEYRIIIRPQEELLRSLVEHGKKFWGESALVYLNDLAGDHLKIMSHLEAYREAVLDFEDTNNQLMNVKTNEVMKTFTILAFLTFPLMLIAALFNMRTYDTPLITNPHGFWIIVGGMCVAIAVMYMYFRKKDWL